MTDIVNPLVFDADADQDIEHRPCACCEASVPVFTLAVIEEGNTLNRILSILEIDIDEGSLLCAECRAELERDAHNTRCQICRGFTCSGPIHQVDADRWTCDTFSVMPRRWL